MIKVILENTLHQISDLLKQLTQEEYAKKDELLSGSSIGMHTRHILEFIQCVIDGNQTGFICYDNRKRDKSIELSPLLAIELINSMIQSIESVDELQVITVVGNYGILKSYHYDISSTIQRELAYNIEHAIHHMAIIKIAVKQLFPKVNIPDCFGIAHSTIQHEKLY